jgi:hypothetical protein
MGQSIGSKHPVHASPFREDTSFYNYPSVYFRLDFRGLIFALATCRSFEGYAMTDLAALKASNEQRWANAKLTRARAPEFKALARKAVTNKPRYQSIEANRRQLDFHRCLTLP